MKPNPNARSYQRMAAGLDELLQEVEAERDHYRSAYEAAAEALREDRDKWGFDTLMAVGDALLAEVYPPGVQLISEGDDPGPRLVRAIRDCRAALPDPKEDRG